MPAQKPAQKPAKKKLTRPDLRDAAEKGNVISLAVNYDEKGPQGAKTNSPRSGASIRGS